MKYKLNTPLYNIDGKTPIKDGEGKAATLKSIATLVLVQAPDKPGDEKYKNFALAVKIEKHTGDEVELDVDEVSRLKRLVGELMGPVVVGRVFDLLDQKEEPPCPT